MSIQFPVAGKFQAATSVSITVKDIQKSAAWYRDVAGFGVENVIEYDGKPQIVMLAAGNVKLSLNQDDGKKGWERIKGQGCSFNLWTNDDVDAIAGRIKASGGTLDSEPVDAPWGARFFRLTDPDGFKLAILKPLAPAK